MKFSLKKYVPKSPKVDWGKLIVEVDKRYNFLVKDQEELTDKLIEVGYELLPAPIRVFIEKEKFISLIKDNGNIIWEEYQKLRK